MALENATMAVADLGALAVGLAVTKALEVVEKNSTIALADMGVESSAPKEGEVPPIAKEQPFYGAVDIEYELLGCFPRSEDDPPDEIGELRDLKCKDLKNDTLGCRSGLPFFRLAVEPSGAVGTCFRFCAAKGLDYFGLTAGHTECRCGASEANAAVWRYELEDWRVRALQFNLSAKDVNASKANECEGKHDFTVYRYVGWMEQPEAGGVPWLLLENSPEDVDYVQTLVRGSPLKHGKTASRGSKPQPWPQRFGVPGVRVPYVLDPGLEETTKASLEHAMKEWSYKTAGCVQFYEANPKRTKAKVWVEVTGEFADVCGPMTPGYPADGQGDTRLYLGSCATAGDGPLVLHALGAVLGLDGNIDIPWTGQGGLSKEAATEALQLYPCHGEQDAALGLVQHSSKLQAAAGNGSHSVC